MDDWANVRVRLSRPMRGSEAARGTVMQVLRDEEGHAITVGVTWDHRPDTVILFLVGDLTRIQER
jgi:hypothetical protein